MNDDTHEMQQVTVEEMFKMAQERQPKKPPTNGRGVGIWLGLSGAILFGFEWYCGLESGWMWLCRGVGLFCLLYGVFFFGASFEKVKEG